MARRALPKIDSELDLSRHLKTVEDLPAPWDDGALFGRQAPLEVEIGSGKGLFLQSAGKQRPEHNFLGIEIAKKFARFTAGRCVRHGLDNVVVVAGDGLRVFRELLPERHVAAVHVYFPDPWWKKRHRKRRVMTESFIHDIERVLVNDGRLHFWTDVEEYFQTTLEMLAQHSQLEGPLPVAEQQPEHDLDYRTHFERRMRLSGEPVYRSEFRKVAGAR